MVNVKTHNPMTLELRPSNYTKWSTAFHAMCGKFGLLSHLDVVSPTPTDDAWVQADFCIRSWIFGTVSDSVLNLAMTGAQQTAGQLWMAIADLYQANKAPRAVFLSHEFHSMIQGDSSIDEYCVRMKEAADNLHDVGQTITEPNLVLNLLRGLNEKYQSVADNIAAQEPLTFAVARNQLLLKELRLKNEDKVRAASALLAAFNSAPSGAPPAGVRQQQSRQRQQPRQQQPQQHGNGGRRENTRRDSKRQPWGFDPWTGARVNPGERVIPPWERDQGGSGAPGSHPWQPPRQQGVLGAPPQAHTAFAPVQASSTNTGGPTWDSAGLIAALQHLAVQGSPSWVVDSGASSHMTSSDGYPDGTRDSSLQ